MSPADLADAERETRLNHILADYFDAVERGEHGDPERMLIRHPDLAVELKAFFAEQEQVFGLAGPLRTLIRAEPAASPRTEEFPTEEAGGRISSAAPRCFGDYEVLDEMARGGMGVVYRARQRGLNRLVALKVIRAGQCASVEEVRRFRNEAEMVALLDHPHVVPVHEVGEQAGQLYFSMKLIEGGSLAEHLNRYREDPQAAADLLATVARAVHHAHQRGVLHRDLKPSNILLDKDDRPHVTDFGLARRVAVDSSLTQSGAIVGTPSYLAPEQTTGQKGTVTTATDVYGLGAVLYALLAGRPPFQAENVLETLEQVREREPPSPRAVNRRVSRDLETICLKCLAKEPQRRYASALALAEDLDRFLAGKPIRGRRVGAWERSIKWARRRPLVVAVAGLVLAVLLLGGAILAREAWQRAAVARAVEPALERAELLQEQEWYEEALGILAVAERQLEGRGLGAIRQRVNQRKRDLEMLMRLRDARLRFEFGDWAIGPDFAGSDRKYGEAFAWYDLYVTTLNPNEAARRVRASAINTQLILGLDDWAFSKDRKDKKDKTGGASLRALTDLADDDPWRRRLRAAVGRRDRAMLEELAREEDIASQPPSNVLLLADVLYKAKSLASAERLLRQIQQRFPRKFEVNRQLGMVLLYKEPKDPAGAVRFLQVAVSLQPQIASAYIDLCYCLNQQEKFTEAIEVIEKAIELMPDSAPAYDELANAYRGLGKRKEAFAADQKAIEVNPNYATAHWNLGLNLANQGRFAESLAALKRSLAVGVQVPGTNDPHAQWVSRAELFVKLDSELPKLLAGEVRPADAAECLALALLCHRYKQRYAAAARFYADAFAADAKLVASPLASLYRFYAACSAIGASAGEGQDARNLPDKARETLRRQALDWLRADLAVYRRLLDLAPGKPRPRVQQDMQIWQREDDLAGVRRPEALARLPEHEQLTWLKLWGDVADTLNRAEGNAAPQNKSAPK